MSDEQVQAQQVPDAPPPVVKTPHDLHMARAASGKQHTKVPRAKGPQPGTHAQKHPRDCKGRFRCK